jgi:hypothetical protein
MARDLVACNLATEAIMELVLGICPVRASGLLVDDLYPVAFFIQGDR